MDINTFLAGWTRACDDATLALIATNHQSILGAFFLFGFLMLLVVQLQLLAANASSKKNENGLCNYKIKVFYFFSTHSSVQFFNVIII